MIGIVVGAAVLLFLSVLTFGIRTRQLSAIVASVLLLVAWYCLYGWAMAGLMAGDRLAAYAFLAAALCSLLLAGLLTYFAWRRASAVARARW